MHLDDFELEDVPTLVLRRVAATLHGKPVSLAWESHLGPHRVLADRQALQAALYRLVSAVAEVVDDGMLVVRADSAVLHQRVRYTVQAAAIGRPLAGDALDALARRLALQADAAEAGSRFKRARGRCPGTGAVIGMAGLSGQDLLLRYECVLAAAPADAAAEAQAEVDAAQARAWVIDADESAGQLLARQLQQIGWATTHFRTPAQALRRMHAMPPEQARPALVLCVESPEARADALRQLAAALPPTTHCVLGAVLGSPALDLEPTQADIDVRPWPFSRADLVALTQATARDADAASGGTRPAPLVFAQRRRALIAGGDDTDRLVLTAFVHSLGLEARVAEAPQQVEQACLQQAPDVLLLDLEQPGPHGLAAAEQVRALQRDGVMPPFAIIGLQAPAATAGEAAARPAVLDALLHKPIAPEALRSAMRRVCGWPMDAA